jgi:hypothetical protein
MTDKIETGLLGKEIFAPGERPWPGLEAVIGIVSAL